MPVKPARLLTVIVAVPELPAWRVVELELGEMVKSPTPTVIVVVWESGPLVAVTATAYVPCVDELNAQFELAEPPEFKESIVGEQETDRPDTGLMASVRDTLSAKPPRLVRESVEVPLLPDWNATFAGPAVTEKSTTLTVTWTECETPPLFPVTVTT